MKCIKLLQASLLCSMLLAGCTIRSECTAQSGEQQEDIIEEELSENQNPIEEDQETAEEPINKDDPLAFIQSLESLDEMRVEYQDGMELIITNQEFLDRFVAGLKNKGYVVGGTDTDVEGIDSKTYAWYTIYFHGHTFEIGNYHTKIDDYNVSTISKDYADEPFCCFDGD